jgi:hypothetical protein
MNNQQKIIFEPLSEKKGYCVYYGIPKHSLSIRIKTIMFVIKDDEIVFLPNNKTSQFRMKKECDEFIEKQIMKEYENDKNFVVDD